MNKILLTLGILAAAAGMALKLHRSAANATNAAAGRRQAWITQTQLLARARAERATLAKQVQEMREELSSRQAAVTTPQGSDSLLLLTNHTRLSPAQSERLLAELGFNWHSQPDYVIVSKESLKGISVSGMAEMNLAEGACKVLAITRGERAAIEEAAQQLVAEYQSWAQASVRREEPAGDVLAKYTMTPDSAFSQSLSNRFTEAVVGALGPERGQLLRDYASDWMDTVGMRGGEPVTLTINRYLAGDTPRLKMQISQGSATISTDVSPDRLLPVAFRRVFPGGWTELAQREGFKLPKEFSK
jgi:hypothetical protein